MIQEKKRRTAEIIITGDSWQTRPIAEHEPLAASGCWQTGLTDAREPVNDCISGFVF
jgi:hypothetical protein